LAAELLNEAACTTWEKWRAGHVRRPHQIAGFIFQVALNLLRNRRRIVADRADRRVSLDTTSGVAELISPLQDPGLEERIARKVRALVESLDAPRDRAVLVRFYLNEEDKEQICADLRLSASQFDKILHRARRRLRELLESHGLRGSDLLLFLLCAV
jgi:RNA polymerase sigma-70 factor (ECF subfamily)